MSERERDDGYWKVVAVLNADYRVIECRDGIQWIVQRRFPSQWQGQKYHRSREGLIAAAKAICGECSASSLEILQGLPEWINERGTDAPDATISVVEEFA